MRNAIPIGFIALVGILYMVKEKPSQPGATVGSSKSSTKQSARRAPARRIAKRANPMANKQAMMKKIRAMLAKRRQQKAMRKAMAAKRSAAPARTAPPKVDRAAMMKKIRAMLAKRRQQQAMRKALAAKRPVPAARRPAPAASTPPASTPPRAAPPKMDRAALMKKIRAMLAKRRAQQALKTRAAVPAAPVAVNPADAAIKGSIVELQTSLGNIQVQLFRKKAPITTANFLKYVRSGHYNGTIFHRVIPRFMVQGGGLTPDMKKKKGRAPIRNEADNGLKNELGTLAMARTGYPHSASAQFFINTKNNTFLNHRSKSGRGWGYCVFAKVLKGMDVVMKISGTKTGTKNGRRNVPVTPVMINKAVVVQ